LCVCYIANKIGGTYYFTLKTASKSNFMHGNTDFSCHKEKELAASKRPHRQVDVYRREQIQTGRHTDRKTDTHKSGWADRKKKET
jgi:hypothetical protein